MSENIINECNKFLYDYSKNVSSVTAKRIKYQLRLNSYKKDLILY